MPKPLRLSLTATAAVLGCTSLTVLAQDRRAVDPVAVEELRYDEPFFPGATYDPSIPTVEEQLGFPAGSRAATHDQIMSCFSKWSELSDRAQLNIHARTYEGREAFHMVITSTDNMRRLDEIKDDVGRLADPRSLDRERAEQLLEQLPAVAWMAYSIHGDETSGADAALALAYHLLASTDEQTTQLLEDLVIIIDPVMNPDGRDRFLKQLREHRGNVPNVDSQSLLHSGYWPWGRTNHYLFDLNRDWIFGVHPETRGRIEAIRDWHPLLLVDAHEMGSMDSFLFSPAREPVNFDIPTRRKHWWNVFGEDQAKAFDAFGWRYYTGEWHEELYPGYSSSWASYRGAVGILYEQAGIAEDGIRRPEGRIETYRESVHHQVVSSISNLRTLQQHRKTLLREFLEERRQAVSKDGPYAGRCFAVVPTRNHSRLKRFCELMWLQGFELYRTTGAIDVDRATDQLGMTLENVTIPTGSIIIPNRQPEAHLLSAMLRFDSKVSDKVLIDERQWLLRFGGGRIYDVTAWNLTMMHDLEALTLESDLPTDVEPLRPADLERAFAAVIPQSDIGFAIDGADDNAVIAAAQLMERGVEVRLADRQFSLGGITFARGSIVILQEDNRNRLGDIAVDVHQVATSLHLPVTSLTGAMGAGEEPDLGGRHFILLERPRIAVLSRGGISAYDFGSIWYTLDHRMGLSASYLSVDEFRGADLRRYNVIIAPDQWFGESPLKTQMDELKSWVRTGGTLIAIGRSVQAITASESEFSQVRMLQDVLDKLDSYEIAVLREWQARQASIDVETVWQHHVDPDAVDYPWTGVLESRPDKDELARRDAWQRLFMPQGAMIAGRTDDKHWLTVGLREVIPLLRGSEPVLMAAEPMESPVRYGVYHQTDSTESDEADEQDGAPAHRIGWSSIPDGSQIRVRMSGLLWPEATHRITNSAYVVRERFGDGQIICFASSPTFRASTLGPTRLFMNAMIFGPGCGTTLTILPD